MARVDDYFNAKKIAVEKLAKESIDDIATCSGLETVNNEKFQIPFLNRTYQVSYPDFEFSDMADNNAEVPIQEQVLILHYMSALKSIPASGTWIAYREIPGASFYFSAFVQRAIDPLKKVFGKNIAALTTAVPKISGKPVDIGDAGFEFRVFPKIPLQIIIYEGDDEFAPEANILFDATAGEFLSPEDAAWLAGMVVYRLMALSRP
ncbi:MAG: DUF3786 domain-containing protein [Desulfobacteraceae bacterium]|nr:DUF3786 domain-containing protein [Desulfobacteraceae bacterium]MBC2758192.1 DUF3786 domain-containing protein [Desulfobacteraceae bacterium]